MLTSVVTNRSVTIDGVFHGFPDLFWHPRSYPNFGH